MALNPDIQERLQQEIDTAAGRSTAFAYNSIMEMEFLEMVFMGKICLNYFVVFSIFVPNLPLT